MPAAPPAFLPTCVGIPPDQLAWLDARANARRISRSALVRQAIDALIRNHQRHGGTRA